MLVHGSQKAYNYILLGAMYVNSISINNTEMHTHKHEGNGRRRGKTVRVRKRKHIEPEASMQDESENSLRSEDKHIISL